MFFSTNAIGMWDMSPAVNILLFFQLLVDYLVKPAEGDEVGKIRALYRWLTARLMEKLTRNVKTETGSAIWYIQQIKQEDTDTTTFFLELCR